MSKKSWIAEFYPQEAEEVAKKNALRHSIQKWKGLLPEALKRHRLYEPPIFVSDSTCALCHHYQYTGHSECSECPLYKARGYVRCDKARPAEQNSPFTHYRENKDPVPMLGWLTAAELFDDAAE